MSNKAAFALILLLVSFRLAVAAPPAMPGNPLSVAESTSIAAVIAALNQAKLPKLSHLADEIFTKHRIYRAAIDDKWLAYATAAGDTPYAYTMPDPAHPKAPLGIVLAPRFFAATPKSRIALVVHELGHWMAFQARGSSTEFDGYKLEYDLSSKIGLTDKDGLPYFAMLDGVVEYVVPRDPSYSKRPDIAGFMKS